MKELQLESIKYMSNLLIESAEEYIHSLMLTHDAIKENPRMIDVAETLTNDYISRVRSIEIVIKNIME